MGPMLETVSSLVGLEPLAGSAIRSTALIAIAGLAALALRRAPAATRHLVWTLALLGCVGMPLVSRVVPGWSWSALPAWQGAEETMARIGADPSAATLTDPSPAPALSDRAPETAAVMGTEPQASQPAGVWRPGLADVARIAPVLWLIGVVWMLVRHLFAWASLARVARRSAPVTDLAWRAALARHGATLGLDSLPALRVSPGVPVPIVSGTLRPTILLPVEAQAWAGERRDAVLLHELAHVRRFDLVTARVTQLASTLYWFNPFVWLAARRQREEAERACDDRVLDAGGRASAYASDLLEIARSAGNRASFDAAALAMARRSQLEGRLLAILDPDRPRGAAGRIAIALSVVVAAGSIGVLAAVRPVQSRPVEKPAEIQAQASQATATVPSAAVVADPRGTDAAGTAEALLASAGSEGIVAAGSSDKSTSSSHWNFSDVLKGGTHSSTWSVGNGRGSFKSRGVIRYSDALDDIVGISPGGSVEIEERRGTTLHKALFRNGSGGIERGYTVNGHEHAWDAEARAWFATFVVDLDRRSGRFVDQRFPRLMSEGGPTRVLSEIGDMTSDYGRSVYFRRLLTAPLDEPTMRRLVAQAGREIDSDYELARTLMAAAEQHALEDATTRAAFLEATTSLESDYEHGRVLMVLVERKDLSVGLAQGAIASAATMDSDYEQARVMLALAGHGHVKPPLQRDYIVATHHLASDYERGRVLRALLDHGKLASENVGEMLSASGEMGSDHEHANVLVQLAESMPMNDAERAAFVQATEALSSDYERGRALAALGKASGRR